jgi:two-component system, NtrC family, nitrogen regulation sensor histidine kinase NtrY
MNNTYELAIPVRVGLLLLTLVGVAYALLTHQPVYWIPGGLLAIGQVWELIRYLNRQNRELTSFLESLRYRDFSSNLNALNAPLSVRQARELLNEINRMFGVLARERETEHQYLQNVLALVNTGILSYREETGAVEWMNESLKRLLQVPYVKSLEGLRLRNEPLFDALQELKPGQNQVLTLNGRAVLLSATTFSDEHGPTRLVAFQPVGNVLEANEAQAYQKLLRVLNHEIMNSVAPIASLAETLQRQLATGKTPTQEVQQGIDVIRRRSEGLLRFAQTYRNLNKFSAASFRPVRVLDLFESVLTLLEPTFAQRGLPEPDLILKNTDLTIRADPALIEQVLINLLTNALDALRHQPNPQLTLSGSVNNEGHPVLAITDNGSGIPADLTQEIFVPFFTTKKHGSGIGLSLSRQIMHLHHGSIQVESVEGKGSAFLLVFPG